MSRSFSMSLEKIFCVAVTVHIEGIDDFLLFVALHFREGAQFFVDQLRRGFLIVVLAALDDGGHMLGRGHTAPLFCGFSV